MINILGRKFDPFVSINGIGVDVEALEDGSVTLDQYKTIRANSDGYQALHKKLDNETLIYATHHYLKNCRQPSPTTYDWALQYDIVPELLLRLENKF